MVTASLPTDSNGQTFVSVRALIVGRIWLPYKEVFLDSVHLPHSEGATIPCFVFLVNHPVHGKVLFDLGMRKNAEGYPPAMKRGLEEFKAECSNDIADVLRHGGIDPAEIKTVIYSHLHWDHVGDLSLVPNADVILGEESKIILADAYPTNPNGRFMALPSDRRAKFINFSSGDIISPFGTFDKAVDFFGDGSFYLVDVPGHLPGHLAGAARVAPNSFLVLAGDTCHNRQCYSPGKRQLSPGCYRDLPVAQASVDRLAKLNREANNVVVVLAHEIEREHEMPLFPGELEPWVVREIETKRSGS